MHQDELITPSGQTKRQTSVGDFFCVFYVRNNPITAANSSAWHKLFFMKSALLIYIEFLSITPFFSTDFQVCGLS